MSGDRSCIYNTECRFKFLENPATQSEDEERSKDTGWMGRKIGDGIDEHLGTHPRSKGQKRPRHYRGHCGAVPQETVQPIWTITGLCDVPLVLRESAMVLQYIHEAGWLHRDNAIGFFEECGLESRGLIGDLAFTKKFTIDGSHQMRRHTPNFTAVEVLLGVYQFLPPNESHSELRERLASTSVDVDLPQNTQFLQNEAHDIESLWWIANYVLFFNCDNSVEETPTQEEDRLCYTEDIFPSTAFMNGRINLLKGASYYAKATSWFSSSFLSLRRSLDIMRTALTSCYYEFEGSFPNTARGVFDELHTTTSMVFNTCINQASNITISSFKARGLQRQIDALRASAQSPPAPTAEAEDATHIKLIDALRTPERKLGLRHPQN